jgi:hypothetical protein
MVIPRRRKKKVLTQRTQRATEKTLTAESATIRNLLITNHGPRFAGH